ncbi:hypothetical protein L6R52_11455 [Myxococcota bacterium]|nr:hypothetical protein [Myxococcota bacterium]
MTRGDPLSLRSAAGLGFIVLSSASACAPLAPCAGRVVRAGDALTCPVPGWTDRAFDVQLPSAWDGTSPLPVIVAFHGGGGNKKAAARTTCANGETDDASCLAQVATSRGFAFVRPDGTGARPATNVRTWNAGGGVGGLNCASGPACRAKIDDVGYFDALVAELGETIPVDAKRVFLTGLSNGAAISHRLACERPDVVAAIAPIGGANQFAAAGGVCHGPVPVLYIHGTEDPCWTYARSDRSCLSGDGGVKEGAAGSLEVWRVRNGCDDAPTEALLPDLDPSDGTRVVSVTWPGCQADLVHLRVEGGGHTWPNGDQYFSTERVGRVTRDVGNEAIVEFFLAHPKP